MISASQTLVRLTNCPDELLGGPITIVYPGDIAADTKDEAEQKIRSWFSGKTPDEIIELLVPRNCSGLVTNPCPGYVCEDGRCEFDYEIAKLTVTQVKPRGTTAKLNKPTKARWNGSLEVWWGCFCEEPV